MVSLYFRKISDGDQDFPKEMHIKRTINLNALLKRKSYFLFGPRATGKSTVIREQLGDNCTYINLLRSREFLPLQRDPSSLEDIVEGGGKELIVIDEVQKLPEILDEVHNLIESSGSVFLLTGSSARKLKRGGANMLAGRAGACNIFSLTSKELLEAGIFDLEKILRFGSLPFVYLSKDPQKDLYDYVDTYLQEEIQAEAMVRNLSGFTRFLHSAALSNTNVINFSKLGNDAQISPSTAKDYFQILEDTLVGFNLPPWVKSKKRKSIQTAKFYLFDIGVTHTLAESTAVDRNSDLYGKSFEQFIALELRAWLAYSASRDKLSFWRSKHGLEVDFVVGDHSAIEVKAARNTSNRDEKGLNALAEEGAWKNLIVVNQSELIKKSPSSEIVHMPYQKFLKKLWANELF